MNRWIRRTLSGVSLGSAVALLPAGVALAQQPSDGAQSATQDRGRHGREGAPNKLLREASTLDGVTAEQRTAMEGLVRARQAAALPVRQANAHVLLQLAQQVEQASIDDQALAPTVAAEESAAAAESAVARDTLTRLHALLTPAQRAQLVERLKTARDGPRESAGEGHERHHRGDWGRKLALTAEQRTQVAANLRQAFHGKEGERAADGHVAEHGRPRALESFVGDSFDASSLVHVERRGEREETVAKAILPVLTPAQRAAFASRLRAHAAHESS
ncbi:MAG: hypothetical protein M3O36_14390 [Myxococcota bacterium]|nr:hypothetical protein [Myxococcota bacterium]